MRSTSPSVPELLRTTLSAPDRLGDELRWTPVRLGLTVFSLALQLPWVKIEHIAWLGIPMRKGEAAISGRAPRDETKVKGVRGSVSREDAPDGHAARPFLSPAVTLAVLAGLLTARICVQFHGISEFPRGFEGDEQAFIITSWLHRCGVDPSALGIWGLHTANAHNFPVSAFLCNIGTMLFGPSLLGARAFLAVLSTVSLGFAYLFLTKVVRKGTALVGVTLLSFSAYLLIVSRVVYAGYFHLPVLLMTLFVLTLCVSGSRWVLGYAVLLGLLTAASLLVYDQAYTLPAIIGLFLVFFPSEGLSWRRRFAIIGCFVAGLLPFCLQITRSLSSDFAVKQYALRESVLAAEVDPPTRLERLGKGLGENLRVLKTQLSGQVEGDHFLPGAYFVGSLVPHAILGLFIAGLGFSLRSRKYAAVGAGATLHIIVYHVVAQVSQPRSMVVTVVLVYLVAAIGLDGFASLVSRRLSWRRWFPGLIGFLGVLGLAFTTSAEIGRYEDFMHQKGLYYLINREAFQISQDLLSARPGEAIVVCDADPEGYGCMDLLLQIRFFDEVMRHPGLMDIRGKDKIDLSRSVDVFQKLPDDFEGRKSIYLTVPAKRATLDALQAGFEVQPEEGLVHFRRFEKVSRPTRTSGARVSVYGPREIVESPPTVKPLGTLGPQAVAKLLPGLVLTLFPNDRFEGPGELTTIAEAPGFDCAHNPYENRQVSLRYEGLLEVREGGEYWILLDSDDESTLFLDGKIVTRSPAVATPYEDRIHLDPGLYELHVDYQNNVGPACLRISWTDNGRNAAEQIPQDCFFHADASSCRKRSAPPGAAEARPH